MPTACGCSAQHVPVRVVVTGGPGAGKTALLEVVQQHFCRHVVVLPEAAGVIFGGGFPRRATTPARHAAQRAIFRVQRELERMVEEEGNAGLILCDRGTVDGLAYWDRPAPSFWADVGSTAELELARYAAVIHLRTPHDGHGYDHSNPLRIESAREALRIDERLLDVWAAHPDRTIVEHTDRFVDKLARALDAIRRFVPACCSAHEQPQGR